MISPSVAYSSSSTYFVLVCNSLILDILLNCIPVSCLICADVRGQIGSNKMCSSAALSFLPSGISDNMTNSTREIGDSLSSLSTSLASFPPALTSVNLSNLAALLLNFSHDISSASSSLDINGSASLLGQITAANQSIIGLKYLAGRLPQVVKDMATESTFRTMLRLQAWETHTFNVSMSYLRHMPILTLNVCRSGLWMAIR